jgi:hypothetical protein
MVLLRGIQFTHVQQCIQRIQPLVPVHYCFDISGTAERHQCVNFSDLKP